MKKNKWGVQYFNVLSNAEKNPRGEKYGWKVLLEYLGFTAVTKSFGERINKAGVGEYLKGYAWVNRHKKMILVHKCF